jgi:BirA family biotin operon repressor/biotin-[acetyl-CoA-carboxylase] ligase
MIPPIRYVESVTSTNDVVAELGRKGAPHGTAVVADTQTAGRGRLGRTWETRPGDALLMSVLLRPEMPLERTPWVMLAAAVVVAEVGGASLRIKWPNDILDASDRKVAGILAESEIAGGRLTQLVVGIGVNLHGAPDLPSAASLAPSGWSHERSAFAERLHARLLTTVDELGQTTQGVRARWIARAQTLGRRVRIGAIEGIATGLADDGGLVLLDETGHERVIRAGDVEMVANRA